jgi:hypothetical protein
MLFMVIEQFRDGKAQEVYRRFAEKGRMLPEGLNYIDSWVELNTGRCFQLMETADADLFQLWTAQWQDLVTFEIVPVVASKEAAEAMTSKS